jgi:hypothetical protein
MPVYDHSKPLMVGVTFYLASINTFKEVEETISITGSFNFDTNITNTLTMYTYNEHNKKYKDKIP